MYTAEMARGDTTLSFNARYQVEYFEKRIKEEAEKGNDCYRVRYPYLTFSEKDLHSIYKEMHDKRGFYFAYAPVSKKLGIGYAFCIGWGDEEDFEVMASKFLSY